MLQETINSVLSQNFKDFELIIIDDGSTDHTLEILAGFKERIRILRQLNQGPEVARIHGASKARGEYLVFLDSDDLLLPLALATYDRVIRELNSPALIIGAMTYFQNGQKIVKNSEKHSAIQVYLYQDYLKKEVSVGISCSNIVIRRDDFEQTSGIRRSTAESYHMDTYDMLLRFGICGPCAIIQSPYTVAYRLHSTNTIRDVKRMVKGALTIIITEYRGQYPGGGLRRFDRYSCIGGMAWCWTKKCFGASCYKLGLELLLLSSPMLLSKVMKKIWFTVRGANRSLFIIT